ncbi:MAG: hypothetical protein DCC55_29455 [Chloroflexi bacterium]|nr:MAG: hypothetical protein DCC55_29455 [Chloroflexota bacterium]
MMKALDQQQLAQHVTILGWLFIVGHAFFLLIGIFVFLLLSAIGVVSGDPQATAVLGVVGTAVGVLLGILSVPGIVAGFGLLARKAWGRYLAIVVGVLNLINFPIGTLIGLYTLWVLMQESATDYFVTNAPAP